MTFTRCPSPRFIAAAAVITAACAIKRARWQAAGKLRAPGLGSRIIG